MREHHLDCVISFWQSGGRENERGAKTKQVLKVKPVNSDL